MWARYQGRRRTSSVRSHVGPLADTFMRADLFCCKLHACAGQYAERFVVELIQKSLRPDGDGNAPKTLSAATMYAAYLSHPHLATSCAHATLRAHTNISKRRILGLP